MYTKFIELDKTPLAFRNRLKTTEKELAQILGDTIYAQCDIQNITTKTMSNKVAQKLLSLSDNSISFALNLNWVTPKDIALLRSVESTAIARISATPATNIMNIYTELDNSGQLHLAEKYCQRLLTPQYNQYLANRFSLKPSHVLDIIIGQIYPVSRLEKVINTVIALQEQYNCNYTTALRIAKANSNPEERLKEIEQLIKVCTKEFPEVSPSDIRYVCLECANPVEKLKNTLDKAATFAVNHQINQGLAFWYILHHRDPEKKLLADTLKVKNSPYYSKMPFNFALHAVAHNEGPHKALIQLLKLRQGELSNK